MNLNITTLMEAITWAAASGHLQDIETLLITQEIPPAIRAFGAEVAAAGGHHAIVALLAPTLH